MAVLIDSVSGLYEEAVRLLTKHPSASHIELRELRRGRWHQLLKWAADQDQDAFLVRARPFFPQTQPWSLWCNDGRRKLDRLEIGLTAEAAAEDAPENHELEIFQNVAAPILAGSSAPLPMVKTSDAVERLGLGLLREAVAVYQRETERLRSDLAEARSMISHLVAELENSGRGSQGQLLKLIGTQSELLADSWKHQGSEAQRERRRLEALRDQAGEATEVAAVAVADASEKQAAAEQESVLLGALMEHLGPKILDMVGGDK